MFKICYTNGSTCVQIFGLIVGNIKNYTKNTLVGPDNDDIYLVLLADIYSIRPLPFTLHL